MTACPLSNNIEKVADEKQGIYFAWPYRWQINIEIDNAKYIDCILNESTAGADASVKSLKLYDMKQLP